MREVYLFDWGDTLMLDQPGMPGKMCDWPSVTAVDGATEALRHLSQHASIYIATGAADSTEDDIRVAFERVELDRYLSGYFCQANLGVTKGSPEFLPRILQRLDKQPTQVTLVGDSFSKDIAPALALGIQPIWLTTESCPALDDRIQQISSLRQLCLTSSPRSGS